MSLLIHIIQNLSLTKSLLALINMQTTATTPTLKSIPVPLLQTPNRLAIRRNGLPLLQEVGGAFGVCGGKKWVRGGRIHDFLSISKNSKRTANHKPICKCQPRSPNPPHSRYTLTKKSPSPSPYHLHSTPSFKYSPLIFNYEPFIWSLGSLANLLVAR